VAILSLLILEFYTRDISVYYLGVCMGGLGKNGFFSDALKSYIRHCMDVFSCIPFTFLLFLFLFGLLRDKKREACLRS
jgi:ABC-type microcin C transport system permease subunit YejE